MRKLFLILSAFCLCFAAQAQEESFKPTAGNVTLEVGLVPFSGSPIGINYLRGRYFLSDDLAFRGGLQLNYQSSRPDDKTRSNSSTIAILPGIEKHFSGTGRLSPYVGGEVYIRSASTKEINFYDTRDEIIVKNRGGYVQYGANLLAGADYYFTRYAYLGVELSYGFGYHNDKDIEATNQSKIVRGGNFYIGQGVNSAIRLGFVLF